MLAIMVASDVAGVAKAQRRVVILTGAEARAHMEQMRASHPGMAAAHERAIQALQANGYKPTNIDIVKIVTSEKTLLQRALNRFAPALAAQTYTDNSTGEHDVSAWDAGDNSIFTGESSIIDYNSDGWGSGTIAFDVSSSSNFHLISASGDCGPGSNTTCSFQSAIADWAACSVAGCAGALTACWLSGPGWGACTLSWCGGSEVACAIGGIVNHIRHRQG